MTELKVHTNNKFKNQLSPKCVVQMDEEKMSFTEFVVVGYNERTGGVRLIQNSDALTLGIAHKLITARFVEAFNNLSEELKLAVDMEVDKFADNY